MPDTQRAVRSVLSARYHAGDFRTLSAAYRFTRGQAEQIDFGWQWPITAASGAAPGTGNARSTGCNGRLYSVGRVNYSMIDSRITDSLLGLEYDAGCWIGRIVLERLQRSAATAAQRILFQLEFNGFSRIGSSPLQTLRDNVPRYQYLREETLPSPSRFQNYD